MLRRSGRRDDGSGLRWAWGACAGLLATLLLAASSPAAGVAGLVRLAPAAAAPPGARALGALPAASPVSGAVVLEPRDNSALQRFITAVSDPASPEFRHYLEPGQYAARFGPARSTVSAVVSRLRADGLKVGQASSDGLLVPFQGSAARVQTAFHTRLESLRLPSGAVGRQASAPVSVPAALGGSVAAVIGLDDTVGLRPQSVLHADPSQIPAHTAARSAAFSHPPGSPNPCADARQAAIAADGLTDDQIANAYGAFGLYAAGDLGAGQHIGIYENEPFLRSDIETFDTCYFGAAAAQQMMKRLHVIPVDGGEPSGPGSGEASLDVEDISAMAPGATIDVYEGPYTGVNGNVYDSLDEYTAMVDADRDQVMSTSWGLCEQTLEQGQPGMQQAENLLFEQAAAQGQTLFDAAGDNGSDDCEINFVNSPDSGQNPVSVEDPASQPYVVGVGGTSIDDASTQPPTEQVWNDGGSGGAGGGGISMSWPMPAWQRAATVPGIVLPGSADYENANSVEKAFGYPQGFCQTQAPGAGPGEPCRLVPDVSAQADEYTGSVTVYSAEYAGTSFSKNGWTTTGGTSSAAPIWAAMLADVNASSTCASDGSTVHGVGFASPLLYAVASNPSEYRASFNDITLGNNDVFGLDGDAVYPATQGYDLASGLGSPQLTGQAGSAGLAYYLCSFAAGVARPVVSQLTPASGSTAGGERVKITGQGFERGGHPDVADVQVGGYRLPSTGFTVTGPTSILATMPPAAKTLPPAAPPPQDGAGPAEVVVTLSDDESSATSAATVFEYVDESSSGPVPSVTAVSPWGGNESAPGTVTILGSGFTGATQVTFGGVRASSFRVLSPYEITATPPPYSASTSCAPLPGTGVYKGENATNDICQVYVRVTNPHGTSAPGHIRPPLEGAITVDNAGVIVPPPGCGCEAVPAPTEFDYLPTPAVTSISTSAGPSSLASENGGTVVTAQGRGFDPLDIEWADFGPAGQEASQDLSFVYLTGTEMQVVAPSEPLTVDPLSVPFSVRTLGGQSNVVSATYAGVPKVSKVVNLQSSTTLDGVYGAPDTGGTPLRVEGQGFAGQLVGPVQFEDALGGPSTGTNYDYTIDSASALSTSTVAQAPALVDVEVCTVTGCSHDPPADELWLYAPGNPVVNSVSPSSGPPAGGTDTLIQGQNLGCPVQVYFGNKAAEAFKSVPAVLDCGSDQELHATSPPGAAGATVPVTVTTVESYFTGFGRSTTTADFTYAGG